MKLKRALLIITALLGVTITTSPAGDPSARTTTEKTAAKSTAKIEEVIPGTDVQPAAYFYTGKPYDEDLGGYVFNYRTYSHGMTRWTTSDPSGFPDGPNTYSYMATPLVECDPLGLYKFNFANQTWTCSFSLAIYDGGDGTGPLKTSAILSQWTNAITNLWRHTGKDKSNGNTLDFKVVITPSTYAPYTSGRTVGQLLDQYDFVASLQPGDYRSNVWRGPQGNGRQGFWCMDASDLVIAHEAGHLMKARDFYTDIQGRSVPETGWEHTLMGAAETPVSKDWNEVILRNNPSSKHLFE